MKKAIVLISISLFFIGIANAQDDELPPPSSNPQQPASQLPVQSARQHKLMQLSKYIIEPDLMFSSSLGAVSVGISPYVGHQLWGHLYGGAGITYISTDFKNIAYADGLGNNHLANAHWNTYGGGVYLQYNIWRGLFVRDQFEVLHRDIADIYNASLQFNAQGNTYSIVIPKIQRTFPSMLVGVGYNLLETKNFFLPLTVSYNVLSSTTNRYYAVYNGLVMQFGFIKVF